MVIRYRDKIEGRETYRGLRGISEASFDDCTDLNEYADVRGRLVEGSAVASSSGSGTARFFPFVSRTGSLMAKAAGGAVGLRRVLEKH